MNRRMAGKKMNMSDLNELGRSEIDDQIKRILSNMTMKEKISQMSGDKSFLLGMFAMIFQGYNSEPVTAGENSRLNIPPIRFTDGPKGIGWVIRPVFPSRWQGPPRGIPI